MVIPAIRFQSFDSAQTDPGITRHLESGSFAYIKTLGSTCPESLRFENLILDQSLGQVLAGSKVAVVNFVFPDLLSISGITTVNNFRLWLPTGSGTAIASPYASLQYITSGTWITNPAFASGQGSTLSSTLPTTYNIRRLDGNPMIQGYSATQVSEYVYFKLFLSQDFPTGSFGGCGSGILRLAVTFDFY